MSFDTAELTEFDEELLTLAKKTMPKESKRFLRAQGNKLKKATLKTAKMRVKKHSGDYFKSIKRGKVYIYRGNGGLAIRVYSNAPYAHFVEHGHRLIIKGKESGFVQGKHVFEDTRKDFQDEFSENIQEFIDDVLDKGLA